MRSTSDLLLALQPAAVATLGDNQYENASLAGKTFTDAGTTHCH